MQPLIGNTRLSRCCDGKRAFFCRAKFGLVTFNASLQKEGLENSLCSRKGKFGLFCSWEMECSRNEWDFVLALTKHISAAVEFKQQPCF